MKTGIELITEERRRQVEVKGWSLQRDDEHTDGALAVSAAQCACDGTDATVQDPLERDWGIVARHGVNGKQPDRLHMLAVAGALIAAEIDRIQRVKGPPTNERINE